MPAPARARVEELQDAGPWWIEPPLVCLRIRISRRFDNTSHADHTRFGPHDGHICRILGCSFAPELKSLKMPAQLQALTAPARARVEELQDAGPWWIEPPLVCLRIRISRRFDNTSHADHTRFGPHDGHRIFREVAQPNGNR